MSSAQPAPAADAPLTIRDRAHLRDVLVKAGLARAAAEKVASGGWPELSGDRPPAVTQAEIDAMAAEMAALRAEIAEACSPPRRRSPRDFDPADRAYTPVTGV